MIVLKIFNEDLAEQFSKRTPMVVRVWLPKFEVQVTVDLKSVLGKMGVESISSAKADFSAMAKQSGLYVSDMLQKCIVKAIFILCTVFSVHSSRLLMHNMSLKILRLLREYFHIRAIVWRPLRPTSMLRF